MESEVAVLLMSHGNFAKEAMKSAELIIGKQANMATLGVHLEDQVDALREEMLEKVKQLDTTKGLVVVTDIIGGTPMNLAGALIGQENLVISSGLSLPLLLELLLNRTKETAELVPLMQQAYQAGQTIRTSESFREEEDEDDSIL
ncbi:PTS sugar transporter subunit IIA [Isobaculum melis]|uniref:PTS system, mannose-specific IIA component n=1 Tax=Isobaculum melis TaxID=142588 RepID=A0A1H9SVH3_9LACT|nr:PTS beta-glucoside transporter subunit IIA [Isobaculum melis]SER88921.1 PTS system, mannose-specific IIA component [Isobaculum melis]